MAENYQEGQAKVIDGIKEIVGVFNDPKSTINISRPEQTSPNKTELKSRFRSSRISSGSDG